MSLRILIADDEPLARARLRALVEELGHEVCAEAGDGRSVKQKLHQSRPDALLLDIEMPAPDGLTLAKWIAWEHPSLPVVLVTAHPEYALSAFDCAVCDYVLKPVRVERLKQALERASGGALQGNPSIHVMIGRKELLVPMNRIDSFVAEEGYVVARSARMEGFVNVRLFELEEQFGDRLLRVHRSCLAVKSAVAGMETRSATDHRLLFSDGMAPAPISRRELNAVRAFLRTPLQGEDTGDG